MKNLFGAAERYIADCKWYDMALLKFCLFAMGLIAGLFVPKKSRNPVLIAGLAVFAATCVPQMAKFLKVLKAPEEV